MHAICIYTLLLSKATSIINIITDLPVRAIASACPRLELTSCCCYRTFVNPLGSPASAFSAHNVLHEIEAVASCTEALAAAALGKVARTQKASAATLVGPARLSTAKRRRTLYGCK